MEPNAISLGVHNLQLCRVCSLQTPYMLYNLEHCSPEVLTAHSGQLNTRIDAQAQDMWGVGSLFLYTLTQRTWFVPELEGFAAEEVVAGMQALHAAWVSRHM